MSTPPRRDPKSAAKRRAANRRKLRDVGRYVFAYAVVGLLLIGTISTVFVAQAPVTQPVTNTTPTVNPVFGQIMAQADTAMATGDTTSAIQLYTSYVLQNPTDADAMFKLGKAYVDSRNTNPDYVVGLNYLQRAVSANPSGTFVAEANQLIAQYQDKAVAASSTMVAEATRTTSVTGTEQAPITGTTVITP